MRSSKTMARLRSGSAATKAAELARHDASPADAWEWPRINKMLRSWDAPQHHSDRQGDGGNTEERPLFSIVPTSVRFTRGRDMGIGVTIAVSLLLVAATVIMHYELLQ